MCTYACAYALQLADSQDFKIHTSSVVNSHCDSEHGELTPRQISLWQVANALRTALA